MKFNNYISVLFSVISLLIFATGCASSADDNEEPSSEKNYKVELSFIYEASWSISGIDDIPCDLSSFISDYLNNGISRHIIRIYKADDVSSGSVPVAEIELEKEIAGEPYDFTETVSLPKGEYVVKAWSDFRESSSSEPYYDVSEFPHLMLRHHSGLSGYQDSFNGTQSFKVDEDFAAAKITMQRPVGRYIIVCEDFSHLLMSTSCSIEDVNVLSAYTGFYPDTYSLITDRLTDSFTGEYFIIKPELSTDGYAIVSSDFMLLNPGGSSAGLQLKLIKESGETVASSESISIPMKRNQITVLKCDILKSPSEGQGGFDLDTDFDGDFVIKP